MTTAESRELLSILSSPKDIVILSHRNPDGDAVGSSLGLAHFLRKMSHVVKVILPSEFPNSFHYLEGTEDIMFFDLNQNESRAYVDEATVIFCLDFNSLDRIDKLGENVLYSTATKVLIDHHLDPEPFADFVMSDTSASSTCEMIYDFIKLLGKEKLLDEKIGTCLLTGLITDTGSFKFGTRPNTYQVAATLKEIGVDDYTVQNHIFNSLKEKHLRLLGHCLANRMEVIEEYGAAVMYLSKEDYQTFDIQRGDTEGIVNYMLMMSHIKIAAFITEQPKIVKISLRSKGDINVQEIASNHFKGGGHKNASGGAAYARLEDVIDRFKKVLPRYIAKR